jgi:hypothetical protein
VLLLLALACTPEDADVVIDGPSLTLPQQIEALPGVIAVDDSEQWPAYTLYRVRFEQPVDHDDPTGPTFEQHIALRHVDTDGPFVLHSTGYSDYTGGVQDELAYLLGSSSMTVEHRYFANSMPDDPDWSLLSVYQAAADHHAIVEAFTEIYTGEWLSTGASKGGEVSLLHRRFFPDDVTATVAYVAPINLGLHDERYVGHFDLLDQDCVTIVRDLQVAAASEPAVKEAWVARADEVGAGLERFGADDGFEFAVLESEWLFWQNDADCEQLEDPTDVASTTEFLLRTAGPGYYSDAQLDHFAPYYFQSAYELGYPTQPLEHLDGLMTVDVDDISPLMPAGVPVPEFDADAMPDLLDWVASSGSELLLIYGEVDPWTAGAVPLGDAVDSARYDAPGGNHGSKLSDLAEGDREDAMQMIERWAGATAKRPWLDKSAAARPGLPRPLRSR